MKSTCHAVLCVSMFLVCAGMGASEWTADDLVTAEGVASETLSRDGALLAWVQSKVVKVEGDEKRVSSLWMARTEGGDGFQLTRGNDGVSSPVFSPDGAAIAFLSSRKQAGATDAEGAQVWVISTRGGEAHAVTSLDRAVRSVRWRDADTLVFLVDEAKSLWAAEREKEKDTSVVVDDAERTPPRRLYEVAADGGSPKPLSSNDDWVSWFVISPDGGTAVVQAERSLSYEFDEKVAPRTFLLDLESGEETPVLDGSRLLPVWAGWATDGSGFFFIDRYTHHPVYRQATVSNLHFLPVADGAAGAPEQVSLDWPRGLTLQPTPVEGGAVVLLADGVRRRSARVRREGTGWSRELLEGERLDSVDSVTASADGRRVAFRYSRAIEPIQLFHSPLDGSRGGEPTQATKINEGWKDKEVGHIEVVEWTGAEGDTVEGILLYPLDWQEGDGARPLVLQIHGGPTGVDRDTWDASWARPIILFRQRGAFVLRVNYHGSGGYGLEWAESIGEGRAYDLEYPDIEAGVDAMIERGLADPDKLGVAGWSYGGIMAADLITKNRRYKAAQVGAADVEWVSDWANVDFGAAYDNYYFGGTPWEKLDVYLDKSPFFKLPEVTTPTIIFTGTADRNVPPHQSWSLFRALQQETDTPVRLVLFPGEPHGLQKVAHQRRKIEEEMAWFDRHLFGSGPRSTESLKEGSVLAAKLERGAAQRDGAVLGIRGDGFLRPETALLGDLEVARFEVTRAQYASIGSSSEPPDERESNLPVTGVSFEEAQGWTRSLSSLSGMSFRLATEKELRRLASLGGKGGNTLDRWAGYAVNPDDAAALRELAADLGGNAPLLLEVGSLPGKGDPMIFDLDGNVGEWAVGEDGEAVVVGPSADRAAGAGEGTNDAAYIGFRVVVDPGS